MTSLDADLLHGLFAGRTDNLNATASAWARSALSTSVPDEAWPEWAATGRHPAQALWLRLTSTLVKANLLPLARGHKFVEKRGLPHPGKPRSWLPPGEGSWSIFRATKRAWLRAHAGPAALRELAGGQVHRCAETGDGHYLDASLCRVRLALDKYDRRAAIALDLDEPPGTGTPLAARRVWGSVDVLHSHDVFEHLRRPEVALDNFAALLRPGGVLVWSAPLVRCATTPNPRDTHHASQP